MSLCLAVLTYNNESTILQLLESVYAQIHYWIICDANSTDNTTNLISDFFVNHKINGELYKEEWKNANYNKTFLFEKCYNKTDYILHIKPTSILINEIPFELLKNSTTTTIGFYVNHNRNNIINKKLIIFNNRYLWRVISLCNTKIVCKNNINQLKYHDLYNNPVYINENMNINYNNILILEKQYELTEINDIDNIHEYTVWCIGNAHFKINNYEKALFFYNKYLKFKNSENEYTFVAMLHILHCYIEIKKSLNEIVFQTVKTIKINILRSEPHILIGKFFYDIEKYELAYFNFKIAIDKEYDVIIKDCYCEINISSYNPNIELIYFIALSCYFTNRIDESNKYIKLLQTDSILYNKYINITQCILSS
jgi:hypothetical protein